VYAKIVDEANVWNRVSTRDAKRITRTQLSFCTNSHDEGAVGEIESVAKSSGEMSVSRHSPKPSNAPPLEWSELHWGVDQSKVGWGGRPVRGGRGR
jgi:hypothetical protein